MSTTEKKPTAREILLQWLQTIITQNDGNPVTIYSTDIEIELRQWALTHYNKMHSPSTWARRWREVREDGMLEQSGIERAVPFDHPMRKQRGWVLHPTNN